MLIIGERINTSRKEINTAVRSRDEQSILRVAREQKEAGVSFLDVNCGTLEDEPVGLTWLVQTIQEEIDVALCLDSPDPEALRTALPFLKGKPMINSISLERERFASILPLVLEYRAAIIALTMGDQGLPQTMEERLELADKLVSALIGEGVPLADIYLDPLVRPVGTDPQAALTLLETIKKFRATWPEVHIICGLSNISYGLPLRRLVNQAFLVLAIEAGLDAVIFDPLDRQLVGLMYAARLLTGADEYGLDYLQAYRAGRLESHADYHQRA